MSEKEPSWSLVWRNGLLTAGTIGALIVWLICDGPKGLLDLRGRQRQDAVESSPQLVVMPKFSVQSTDRAVREIVVEARIENRGLVNARIDSVTMEVAEGSAVGKASDYLHRTQQMRYWHSQSQKHHGTPQGEEAQKKFDEVVAEGCPHGELFSLRSKEHVKWKILAPHTQQISDSRVLRPKEKFVERFTYVLTEPDPHQDLKWFRFDLTLQIGDRIERYPVVMPSMLPNSGIDQMANIFPVTTQMKTGAYEWSPSAPLYPQSEVPGPVEE